MRFLIIVFVFILLGCSRGGGSGSAEAKARAVVDKAILESGGILGEEGDRVIEIARQSASEINRGLPMDADSETRVDTTFVGPGRVYTYSMTLVNHEASDISIDDIRALKGDSIKNGICSASFMKFFVENKFKVVYLYRGRDGGFIGELVVDTDECY